MTRQKVQSFIDARVEKVDVTTWTYSKDLLEAYRKWSGDHGMGATSFGILFADQAGVTSQKGKEGNRFFGVRLKPELPSMLRTFALGSGGQAHVDRSHVAAVLPSNDDCANAVLLLSGGHEVHVRETVAEVLTALDADR